MQQCGVRAIENASPSDGAGAGEAPPGWLDRSIAFTLGFCVPLISLFRENWLEYVLPLGLVLTVVHLGRLGTTWRDYLAWIPRAAGLAVAALVVAGLVAASRGEIPPVERLRWIAAALIPYFALYAAVFFLMIRGSRLQAMIVKALAAGIVAAAVLLLLQPLTGIVSDLVYPPFHTDGEVYSLAYLNRTMLAMALASWMLAPWARSAAGSALAGAAAPAAVWLVGLVGESETVLTAIPVAIGVYAAACLRPRLTMHALFAVLIVVLMCAPLLYPALYEAALPHAAALGEVFMVRAEIWDAVARYAMETPLTGHGVQALALAGPVEIARTFYPYETIPHPHNGFLQIWSDMGLVGALAGAGLLAALWSAMRDVRTDCMPHLLALLTLAVLAFLSTYNLWAPWWLALLGIVAAIATGTARPAEPALSHRRRGHSSAPVSPAGDRSPGSGAPSPAEPAASSPGGGERFSAKAR